jgi:hypothetical protein
VWQRMRLQFGETIRNSPYQAVLQGIRGEYVDAATKSLRGLPNQDLLRSDAPRLLSATREASSDKFLPRTSQGTALPSLLRSRLRLPENRMAAQR